MHYWGGRTDECRGRDPDVCKVREGVGFLRPPRRMQADPMIGAMLTRFDEVPQKAKEICPLHQEQRGRCTNGKILFLLLFLIFALALFTALAHGQQPNATTVKVAGTVFVQDSAGNRSVVAG